MKAAQKRALFFCKRLLRCSFFAKLLISVRHVFFVMCGYLCSYFLYIFWFLLVKFKQWSIWNWFMFWHFEQSVSSLSSPPQIEAPCVQYYTQGASNLIYVQVYGRYWFYSTYWSKPWLWASVRRSGGVFNRGRYFTPKVQRDVFPRARLQHSAEVWVDLHLALAHISPRKIKKRLVETILHLFFFPGFGKLQCSVF